MICTDLFNLDLLKCFEVCCWAAINGQYIGMKLISIVSIWIEILSRPMCFTLIEGCILQKIDRGWGITDLELKIIIVDSTERILLDHSNIDILFTVSSRISTVNSLPATIDFNASLESDLITGFQNRLVRIKERSIDTASGEIAHTISVHIRRECIGCVRFQCYILIHSCAARIIKVDCSRTIDGCFNCFQTSSA